MVPEVICAVEDGWCGMRRFSLSASRSGHAVLVLIRGSLEPEVLAMISLPERMQVRAIPRRWFRWRLLWDTARAAITGRLRWLIMTRERTRRFIEPIARLGHARVLRLIETDGGYRFDADCGDLQPASP